MESPSTNEGQRRSDEKVLASARTDVDAFEEIYRRLVGDTVAFASRRCSSPDQVHDLVAAIWLEVLGALERFDPGKGKARPWVLGIAANLIADDRRRRAREWEALRRLGGRRVLDGEEDLLRIESRIDATRITPAVLQELQKLPPGERVAIDLVAFDGLTQEEAAEALDLDPVAFRMRLSRARTKLRIVMAPEDEAKGVIAR